MKRLTRRRVFAVLGVVLVLVGALAAVAPARRMLAYGRARESCPQRSVDCLPGEAAHVTKRREGVIQSDVSTPTYHVWLDRADGTVLSRDVNESVYRQARIGGPATIRSWDGRVVQIRIGTGTEDYMPSGVVLFVLLMLVWTGVGLLFWIVRPRTLRSVHVGKAAVWTGCGVVPLVTLLYLAIYGGLPPHHPEILVLFWVVTLGVGAVNLRPGLREGAA